MLYQLKERVWSWTDTYDIKDEAGNPVLYVKGKFFSWGDNLAVCDVNGYEVAQIRQRLLSFMPAYELHRNGNLFAEIVKKFTWFKSKFVLDVPGPNDYEIDGSFWQYEYTFRRSGRVVATVSKQFWSWGDTYGVNIVDGEDDISILATVIVIDLVCHEDKNSQASN